MKRETVAGFLRGEIVEIPVKVVAVVHHASAEAMGFGNVDAALLVEGDRGGRRELMVLVSGFHFQRTADGDTHPGDGGGGHQTLDECLAFAGRGRKFLVRRVSENDVVHADEATGCGLVV